MGRHIRKDDLVSVISGDDAGKQGKVLRVIPDKNRVVVQGINVHRRHTKPSKAGQGGIITKELPIHISNVAPISEGKGTRVRFQTRPDGSKVRVGVKSGQPIGQPLRSAQK